ncbi:unnamed protein product [Triticum turgidum subsp. durum]|uniref:U3 small nucleolar RNA-associated protein 18 homolog n=1 Tax=Triticum turgidum subsp. durum TaxID=4567 RepID=A0A9R1AS31_TRITD|nr:unnamed protein product [Triticum turgidum subsp. durum]
MTSLISQNALQKRRLEKDDDSSSDEETMDSPVASDAEAGKKPRPEDRRKDRKRKKKALQARQGQEADEMRRLESSLFGNIYTPLEFGTEAGAAVPARDQDDDAPLFFVDRSAGDDLPVYEEDLGSEDEVVDKGRKPAWVDEEEDSTEVDILKVARLRKLRKEADERVISGKEYEARLRGHHAKLNPFTGWADMDRKAPLRDGDSNEEEGGVDNMLRSNDELVVKGTAKLLPGMLDYSRLVDVNAQDPSSGPINSVQFHRNGQLMLVAGLDKHLRFFQIDGKRNPKIQSIFVEDCPIQKAAFLPDGSEVILSGRRKFFYSFDLVKAAVSKIGPLTGREEKSLESFEISPDSRTIAFIGNEGYILLISSKTKQLIGTLKMNGSSSGIVNVYKRDEFLGGKRKPLKTIENLTTETGQMKFNHDAQILAISSRKDRNGMRLVHVPSFTVYQNWPGPRFSLQYPRCLDFSPGSGFLSIGHAGGKVLLYKLHHYQNA